jgi:2-polyprenyl-3-methyl-5-hydroxy-6-metoxy-1,4-benzoquinol methylase
MENLISKEYKEKIVTRHTKKSWGGPISKHVPSLVYKNMILTKANSILDYGAGSGLFKEKMDIEYPNAKFNIHEYEPGIIGKDEDPPICDATVCLDVLEHIEPDKIDNVLQHIYDKTNKWAYIIICCIPSYNTFPDGQNLHILQRESNWWLEKFKYEWNMFDIVSGKFLKVLLIKK